MDRFSVWVGSLIARTQDLKKDDGQTMVEYSLILVLIAVAAVSIGAFTGVATDIQGAMTKVTTAL